MPESLRDVMIRIAEAYRLDPPSFLKEKKMAIDLNDREDDVREIGRLQYQIMCKNEEIARLKAELSLAADTIVQQQGELDRRTTRIFQRDTEIARLRGVIASYESDRLFNAGKGAIGSP